MPAAGSTGPPSDFAAGLPALRASDARQNETTSANASKLRKSELVEWTDAGLSETAVDRQRQSTDAERGAEPGVETAAGNQALDRSRLLLREPGQDRKVVHRIECDQVRATPLDQCRDDALRCDPGDPGDSRDPLRQVGGQRFVRRLHREQARRDVDEGRARDGDEVGAHA